MQVDATPRLRRAATIRNDGVGFIDIVERYASDHPGRRLPRLDLSDLTWHVGEVWDFWSRRRRGAHDRRRRGPGRCTEPEVPSARSCSNGSPPPHTAIYTALIDAPAREREVWTWTGQPTRTSNGSGAAWRQETAVHRWDAAHAVGQPDDIDALVAVRRHRRVPDLLRQRRWRDPIGAAASLGGTVHLHCTDTHGEWFVSSARRRRHRLHPRAHEGRRRRSVAGRAICCSGCGGATPRPVDIVGDAALATRFQQLSRAGVTALE